MIYVYLIDMSIIYPLNNWALNFSVSNMSKTSQYLKMTQGGKVQGNCVFFSMYSSPEN